MKLAAAVASTALFAGCAPSLEPGMVGVEYVDSPVCEPDAELDSSTSWTGPDANNLQWRPTINGLKIITLGQTEVIAGELRDMLGNPPKYFVVVNPEPGADIRLMLPNKGFAPGTALLCLRVPRQQ